MGGRGSYRFEMDRHIPVYLKQITNENLLYSTGNPAQCYMAVWMEGELGEECTHVYAWLSCSAIHLKLSQQCTSVPFQYKIKS